MSVVIQFIILIFCCGTLESAKLQSFSTSEDTQGLTLELIFDAPVKAGISYQANGNVHIIRVPGAISPVFKGRQELDHLLAISFHIKAVKGALEFWFYPRGFFGVSLLPQLDSQTIRIHAKNGYPTREQINPDGKFQVVCIDPGHGGHDPGAPGSKSVEKQIVLALSRQLRDEINQLPGLKAVLTRDADYKLKLEDRPKISDRVGASLFISLHMNSSLPQVRGYEVFYLSEKGATQTLEARLGEAHSQASESIDSSNSETSSMGAVSSSDSILQQIIFDMQQVETLNSSAVLANVLADHLKETGRRSRGVRRAAFVVLKTIDTPSVLIEMGYITNKDDEAFFVSPEGTKKVSSALAKGIYSYLKEQANHPKKTLKEPATVKKSSGNQAGAVEPVYAVYTVKSGDTLGTLAIRHGVRYSSILAANAGLHPDKLFVGQKIRIPVLNE